jgi:hypothetical protein
MTGRLEFWEAGDRHLLGLDSSMVPPVGASIRIAGRDYTVVRVSFSVDGGVQMRCNVVVEPA